MAVTVHVRVSGRVQGVGYRDGLRSAALAQGVSGWVRNRHDGSVEAVLQGDAAAVEAVLDWARCGPPAARVGEVRTARATGEHDRPYSGFDWLPTA
jgi:acylphosphatase